MRGEEERGGGEGEGGADTVKEKKEEAVSQSLSQSVCLSVLLLPVLQRCVTLITRPSLLDVQECTGAAAAGLHGPNARHTLPSLSTLT